MNQLSKLVRSVTRRLDAVPRLLAVACAAVLSLGLLVAFAPASSAVTSASYTLNSGTASFKADGHTWHLQVTAQSGVLSTDTMALLISTSHPGGGTELHSWNASRLPAADLTVNSTGHATLKTGAKLSPVIKASLTFTPKSHSKASCASGSGTNYAGSLAGTVSLTTGLKGIKVSRHFSFGKPNTLEVSHGCVPPTPCFPSLWDGGKARGTVIGSGETVGRPGKWTEITSVAQTVTHTGVANLDRDDVGYIETSRPAYSSAKKTLTVTGSKSGIVTGKGAVHAAHEFASAGRCTLGGHKYSYTDVVGEGTFSSSKTFEARTLLTGTIKVASKGAGYFLIVTLK